MSLQDWRPKGWSIEKEVRTLLKKRDPDPTPDVCKRWTRDFIQALVPGWEPGVELTAKQAQLVGRKFNQLLCRPSPKAPRQENFGRKK